MESDPRFHSIARAIGALTAWLQTDTDPEFLAEEIARTAAEGVEAASELTAGLVNVAGILLVQLEHVEQRPALEILQDLAQRYPAA